MTKDKVEYQKLESGKIKDVIKFVEDKLLETSPEQILPILTSALLEVVDKAVDFPAANRGDIILQALSEDQNTACVVSIATDASKLKGVNDD